ncbi:hypothetical protein HN937_17300, partial [Candidatus Poribacteria bacterium]|nr:hypothetical protein [Candidatus Poribacteria bacterium]
YQLLMALGLQAYVTTNFDPLLLKQFQLCAGSRYGEDIRVPPAQGTLGADGSAFVYLHGGYDAHEEGRHRLLGNLVLTSDDFDEEYSPTGSAGLFVRDLMRANNVVFLGCELRERGLSDALEAARDIRHAQKARGIDAGYELRDHKRVILLPSNVPMAAWQQPLDQPDPARYFAHSELQGEGSGKTPAEVRLRMDELHAEQKRDAELDTDCGIRVVRYDNTQGDYAVLWRTLWHWTQRERPSVTLQGMSPLPGSEDRGDEPHG